MITITVKSYNLATATVETLSVLDVDTDDVNATLDQFDTHDTDHVIYATTITGES